MAKYIISGYIGFDNFGDEAIARVLVNNLKSQGVEKITLISSNPERSQKIHNVDACGMLKFWKPLKEADILISGGGSLLQDVTSFKSLLYYLGVITCALFLKKEVIIFSQGIGPINSKLGQLLTRFILKRCTKISVRDKKSQELLKSWNIESVLVEDPIFYLDLPQKNQKGIIGIQLRDCPALTFGFLKLLAKSLIEEYPSKGFQIISFQDNKDLATCKKFASLLYEAGANAVEVISQLTIDDAIDKISNLEVLYAMRFHANVLGIKSGVKTIAINYDPKVEKLAKQYNLPLIEISQNDFELPI